MNYWHPKNYLRVEHLSGIALSAPCSIDMEEIDYLQHALDALDAVAADGDHGAIMVKGLRRLAALAGEANGNSVGRLLKDAGAAFASGWLDRTALGRCATASRSRDR